MKNYLFAFSILALFGLIFTVKPYLGDPKAKEEAIIQAVKLYLEQVHYSPRAMNDEYSNKAFDLYLESLDANKRFLTQVEVSKMMEHRDLIDDEINNGTLNLFNESNMLIEEAFERAERLFNEVIDSDFDFSIKEEIQMDPEKRDYAIDEDELKESWRKALKYDILRKLHSKLEKQEKSLQPINTKEGIEFNDNDHSKSIEMGEGELEEKKSLKEKNETKPEIKTTDELIEESIEEVKENFQDWFKRLKKLRRSDRFESYVNAIIHVNDPHSDYFNPKEKQDFDIRMSGKLEGIGARLSTDGDYTKVVTIVPGGPAWKQKELEVEDLISAVAQDGEEPISIEGWRIDDVVQKIRGKKGTKVTLTVKKPDGSLKDIQITRDIVVTEDGNAKSAIISLEGVSDNVGYIYLPSFYADFSSKDGRSCAKDIATELEKLKEKNVDGIILDIRNNGGGSLRDVVDMGGLFIEKGPMVQVKPKKGNPYVLEDEDPAVQYNGPLVIMVNDFSVSASEILAAAMQDYKRALIVGSPSTFGKGTVQRFFSLDKMRGAKEFKPMGDVKMTIQKFFRIDGSSTQLRGVEPDIILPDSYLYIKRGEKDYDYPLEWNEIEDVDYDQKTYVIQNYKELQERSKARVDQDEEFNLIMKNATRLKENRDNRVFSLELNEFRSDIQKDIEESKKFENLGKEKIEGLSIRNLEVDLPFIQADSSRIGRNEDFLDRLQKDIYLEETIYILQDMMSTNLVRKS